MNLEADQQRFGRSLNEASERGGSTDLLTWPRSDGKVATTSAHVADIAKMLRSVVKDTDSRVVVAISPTGRPEERFTARWTRAGRKPFDGEGALGADAMDTLRFEDGGKYHFDEWSDGQPYTTSQIRSRHKQPNLLANGIRDLLSGTKGMFYVVAAELLILAIAGWIGIS